MPSECGFSYKDYDGEKTSVRFKIVTMTAANFDATITAINALSAAILALQTENALQDKRVYAQNTFVTRAKATGKTSQREHKWICTFEDATLHTLFRHEIGLADASLVGTDVDTLDLSAGVGQAFKTAAEAIVKSPAGNAVYLMSVQYSGKRL